MLERLWPECDDILSWITLLNDRWPNVASPWSLELKLKLNRNYCICNQDEMTPGTFKLPEPEISRRRSETSSNVNKIKWAEPEISLRKSEPCNISNFFELMLKLTLIGPFTFLNRPSIGSNLTPTISNLTECRESRFLKFFIPWNVDTYYIYLQNTNINQIKQLFGPKL